MKVLILSVLTLATLSECALLQKGCRMKQVDDKMRGPTEMVSNKDFLYPKTEQELDKFCSQMAKQIVDAREFVKKCTRDEAKTILSVTALSLERMIVKTLCRIPSERKRVFEGASCGNKGQKQSTLCWHRMISIMTSVNNITDSKMKIPSLCCTLLQWKECIVNVYEKIGEPVCPAQTIEYWEQFLYKAMLDPLNIFCTEYDESDKCEKVIKQLPKSNTKGAKYVTPFPAILDIFDNL